MIKKKSEVIYKNCLFERHLNKKRKKILNTNFLKIYKKIILDLDTPNNTFHYLSKKFEFNFKLKDLKNFRKFRTVVVIGMGGSILGAEAIYFYLKKKIKKDFLFLNDIDEDKIEDILKLKNLNKKLFIIISKSGSTVETLSNLLALKIVKKKSKNIIVISEKNHNPLCMLSKKMKLNFIEHKKYIGGRYSVLTEVGMVPAYLMGLNITSFRKNLMNHFSIKNKNFLKDSSTKLTNLIENKKFKNIVFLNYAPELDKFLFWLQQLIAESLGKRGKGFFPTISKAPKDHHSLMQLYLDGPKDKLFYIFSKKKKSNGKKLNSKIFEKKFDFINNKSLQKIKTNQMIAFKTILAKKKIPFREFEIKNFSEQTLSELFSFFSLETAIVGKLSKINPFDQPAVEQVKSITKKLLS